MTSQQSIYQKKNYEINDYQNKLTTSSAFQHKISENALKMYKNEICMMRYW